VSNAATALGETGKQVTTLRCPRNGIGCMTQYNPSPETGLAFFPHRHAVGVLAL